MSKSLDNLKEWYEIAEWSIFHGYREISTKALTEIMARGGTIGRDTLLEKRLSFDGYLYSIQSNNEQIFSKLTDSLQYLDELWTSFSKDCKTESTNEYNWLRIRQMTIMQLGILILKEYLHLDSASIILTKPSDITIPRSFQFKNYKDDLEKIFIQHRKYSNTSAIGKFEEHSADILLDTLLKPFLSSNTTVKLKHSLFYIFSHYPIETFRNEAASFAKTVEKEVLPPPGHFVPYLENQTPSETIWNENQRETNGPYAGNNTNNQTHIHPTTPNTAISDTNITTTTTPSITTSGLPQPSNIDGNETDEQSAIDPLTTQTLPPKQNEVLSNNPLDNLKITKNKFVANNVKNDPLLEVAGISEEQQVISVAGRIKSQSQRKKRFSMDPSPPKKRRLIDGRHSASEATWSDTDDDETTTNKSATSSSSKKLAIEKIQKQKFNPQLSDISGNNSLTSSGQSIIERDKGVRLAWTKDEEEALIAGVSIHGAGNWIEILQDPNLSYRFRGRTNVNLKDKYRNMIQ